MALVNKVMALSLPFVARLVAIQRVDIKHSLPYSFGFQLITLLGNEAILRRASTGWVEKYITALYPLNLNSWGSVRAYIKGNIK